jgi:hypothetical protein
MEPIYWSSEEHHADNSETMSEYLRDHNMLDVDCVSGSYAEGTNAQGQRYEIHACGNGDFNNHKVYFVPLEPEEPEEPRYAMSNEELQEAIYKTNLMLMGAGFKDNSVNTVTQEKFSEHLFELLKTQRARANYVRL